MQGRGQQIQLHLGILHLWPNCGPWNWRTYSYCDIDECTKQTAHLYYWFQVTTVFF